MPPNLSFFFHFQEIKHLAQTAETFRNLNRDLSQLCYHILSAPLRTLNAHPPPNPLTHNILINEYATLFERIRYNV